MKTFPFNFLIVASLLFWSCFLSAQFTVSGSVRNEAGEKLISALIYLENTTYATVTDEDGNFEIQGVPSGSYSVKVSYVGYKNVIRQAEISQNTKIHFTLSGIIYNLDKIEIRASRVEQEQPFTHRNISRNEIRKENLGVDMPFLLQWTPSVTVTSDAGNGIGYTGMRIRGSDQTRINVTINGVPLNDAESQDVFWVDLPDLGSSVQSVQIQRGVGPSTNGPGAFGGTIGVQTHQTYIQPYAEASTSYGSFDTRKLQLSLGSGLINEHYSIDGRFSTIRSDGYIERATARLSSWFLSGARVTEKSSLRLNVFSGKEITYQAWNGVPEAKLKGTIDDLFTHYFNNVGSIYLNSEDSLNLFNSDRRYNYYLYPNQVDDYTQTHAQLHYSRDLGNNLKWNSILYYTKGQGFFEQYRYNDRFSRYGLDNITGEDGNPVSRTNIVRRRWLDNDLFGAVIDVNYTPTSKYEIQMGLAANNYNGAHFGNIVFAEGVKNIDPEYRYYDNTGMKTDISTYLRQEYLPVQNLKLFMDLQYRFLDYRILGKDNDLREIDLARTFNFLNPKVGVHYNLSNRSSLYLSWSVGQREPARADFLDNATGTVPEAEFLSDWEAGYKYQSGKISIESNLYFMKYRNQLVLTGDLNDVGAAIRTNVPDSYRLGVEFDARMQLHEKWFLASNLNLSRNKIRRFEEILFDYTIDLERKVIEHQNTDIAFSPSINAAAQILYVPLKNFEAELSTRLVGRQFLDNTSNQARSINPYHFQNLRLAYKFKIMGSDVQATFLLNNVFNRFYESNGYTFSYILGELITENFYYPQAGSNWMMGVNVRL